MNAGRLALSVGCLVMRGDEVLLVKHNYGPTKGRWDFPRGRLEADERMELAAIRELREETAIVAAPIGILAVREQISIDDSNSALHDLIVIWHMKYEANEPVPDGREVSDARFMGVDIALDSPDVSSWTKELIKVTYAETGLSESSYRPSRLPDNVQSWMLYTAVGSTG